MSTYRCIRWRVGAVLLAALLLFSSLVTAQSTAALTGTVMDSTQAVVPEARVLCQNTETHLVLRGQTDSGGIFRFAEVPVGPYEISVSHQGFATLVRGGIQLLTGKTVDLNLVLQVGDTAQSVAVTAPAPLVQATTSELQSTVDSRQMAELPLNGRNAFQLAVLTPGAIDTEAGTVPSQQDNTGLSVNGLRATTNNWALDGGSYTNRQFGSAPTLPNPDTLQEFTALTSNFSAENRGGGAVVKLTTRSGTNQLHGSLFEFVRNDAMDARNFFSIDVEHYKQNQYGGTLGGPLRRDKLFFFGSFQGTNKRGSPSPRTLTVPTLAQRNGDFTQTGRVVVDPTNSLAMPGNVIPRSRLDSIATQLMTYIPLPNAGDNRSLVPPPANRDDYQYMAKLDYVAGPRDHVSGRYFFDRNTGQRDSNSAPGFFGSNEFTNWTVLASEVHTFSPSWVLKTTFNYLQTYRSESPVSPTTMQALGAKVPLAEENIPDKININISGYLTFLTARGIHFDPSAAEFQADVSHAAGAHFLRFGGSLRHIREYAMNLGDERGAWVFNAQRTTSAAVRNSGDSFASFLLGVPATFNQTSPSAQEFVCTLFDGWVQDDWKLHRRLTLNLGIRFDPWLPPADNLGVLPGFVPGMRSTLAPLAPQGLVLSGDPGIPRSIMHQYWNMFSPRFGFAWDASGNARTVVRGGYGMYHDTPEYFGLLRVWAYGAPTRTASISIASPPSTADPYAGYAGTKPFPFIPPSGSQLASYVFPANMTVSAFDPSARPGYTQSWNLTVERQILADTAFSASYVGNHVLGGNGPTNVNPGVYGRGATAANLNSRRVYAGFADINLATSYSRSFYHGLQTQLTRRPAHGLTLQAGYTFSKALDLNSSGSTGGALRETPRDPWNAGLDKGPADFDVAHNFKASILYSTPKLKTGPALVRALAHNWQVNTIATARTGNPFTCRSGVDNSMSGVNNDTCDQLSADISRPAGVDRIRKWFNTAAFTQNAIGTFGNTGRNALRRPGVFNVDVSLFRRIPLAERVAAELRIEAFNAFNRANLDLFFSPGGYTASSSVNSPTFGQITHAKDPRLLQMAMKIRF